MNLGYLFVFLILFFLLVLLLKVKKPKRKPKVRHKTAIKRTRPTSHDFVGQVTSTSLLMTYEQKYYFRIQKMLPSHVLLHTQVSFSAFITSPEVRIRNQFNRSHADLVITDLNFNVLLIIEIDGTSHSCSRVQERDKKRDSITSAAGIPTLRIDDSFSDRKLSKLICSYF